MYFKTKGKIKTSSGIKKKDKRIQRQLSLVVYIYIFSHNIKITKQRVIVTKSTKKIKYNLKTSLQGTVAEE